MGSMIFVVETTSPLKFLSIVYVILFLPKLHIAIVGACHKVFIKIQSINVTPMMSGKYLR